MSAGHALFLVENLSVPADDRVWREACAVRDLGWSVSVVCPTGIGADRARREVREGIEIHRFPAPPDRPGAVGLAREYAAAMWHLARMAHAIDRRRRVDVVHVANPPDLLVPVAASLRMRHPAAVVFDQHDLVPELVATRFPRLRPARWVARALERSSYGLSDKVIVANEVFRGVALRRGRRPAGDVAVVRNAPDPARFAAVPPDPTLRRGRRHLAVYVGVMGPQDGADLAVRALARLRRDHGRDDVHAIFCGRGSELARCRMLAAELGVDDVVEFAGWQSREQVVRHLSSADVALAPDPRNPLNDRSSMVKIAEYLAIGVPIVAFDLPETVRLAAGAARIVPGNDVAGFARAIDDLLDDPAERDRMRTIAAERACGPGSWSTARRTLETVYTDLAAALVEPPRAARTVEVPSGPTGRTGPLRH
ncbi:MAG: glycosyltransferase family 4 protein [Actinomycetota bacterium]|nr:glycosyltransferase family 4 protein [Actinomycetota bacterium]